jgi:hypothetical protein
MLGLSAAGVFGEDRFAVRTLAGTAAFPNVVKNASLGVESLNKPATWVNF